MSSSVLAKFSFTGAVKLTTIDFCYTGKIDEYSSLVAANLKLIPAQLVAAFRGEMCLQKSSR